MWSRALAKVRCEGSGIDLKRTEWYGAVQSDAKHDSRRCWEEFKMSNSELQYARTVTYWAIICGHGNYATGNPDKARYVTQKQEMIAREASGTYQCTTVEAKATLHLHAKYALAPNPSTLFVTRHSPLWFSSIVLFRIPWEIILRCRGLFSMSRIAFEMTLRHRVQLSAQKHNRSKALE